MRPTTWHMSAHLERVLTQCGEAGAGGVFWVSAFHSVGMAETRMMTGGPKTGMRVELSSAFEVLAHELRGCTSVIQGYVRLLQQSRGQADPALLAKLLDATSRLTTILPVS